jgi:hypothetical protein
VEVFYNMVYGIGAGQQLLFALVPHCLHCNVKSYR